jgi:hypothetical protein
LINDDKIKLSIRLIRSAYDAAKSQASTTGLAISVIVAEAATQTLLATYRSDREAEILQAVERVFFKLQKLEKRQNLDLLILKEMVGLGIRAYFNHTPEVPDHERSAALLSGKARFHRYLDTLARNLRQNKSILSDVPELLAIPLAIPVALQGDSNGSTQAESVTSESAPPPMLDPSTNGNAVPGEAGAPPMDNAVSRSKEPIVSHRFAGRGIAIGQDEPGLFHDAMQPDQPEPPAGPNGVPHNNMAEGS